MIALEYRPLNTANTAAAIYLFIKNDNKNTETKC